MGDSGLMIDIFSCVSECGSCSAPRTAVILGASYLPSVNAGLMDDEMGTPENVISIDLAYSILQVCFFNERPQSLFNKKVNRQAWQRP